MTGRSKTALSAPKAQHTLRALADRKGDGEKGRKARTGHRTAATRGSGLQGQ